MADKGRNNRKSYLKRLADPANHKHERLVIQRWLQTIPIPTSVIPYNIHTHTIQPKQQQNALDPWFESASLATNYSHK